MRNHKPVIFEDVQLSGDITVEAGVERGSLDFTLSPEDFARLQAGYLCPSCWEQQPEPFPKKCKALDLGGGVRGCGFPIRKELTRWLEQNHAGDRWLGPTTSDEYELDLLRDHRERKKYRKESQIWLPGDPRG